MIPILVIVCPFDMAISVGVKSYLTVVLTRISLTANDIKHLSMSLLTICISVLEKCLFWVSPAFNWVALLLLSRKNSLYILETSPLSFIWSENIFSYSVSSLLFIYLFMAALGLRFCARAFSTCSERGPLFIVVRGPLTIAASLVAEHRLQTRRLSSCGARA